MKLSRLWITFLWLTVVCITASAQEVPLINDSRIVFITERNANSQVVSIKEDGTDEHIIVENYLSITSAACSPNGQSIAYNLGYTEIVVTNMSNDSSTSLHPSGLAIYESLAWSPNGVRLAFNASTPLTANSGSSIHTSNIDGSDIHQVIQNPYTHLMGSWSPDSMQLVYSSPRGDQSNDIFVSNADGSNEIRLTQGAGITNSSPQWSPIGNDIVFDSDRNGYHDIYLMSSNGNNIRRLTGPNQMSNWSPIWSPDGSKIVFTSSRDGQNDLYIMNVDGSQVQRLTNSPELEFAQCWVISSPTTLAITVTPQ